MLQDALTYAQNHLDDYLSELIELLSYPSISFDDDFIPDINNAADWVVNKLNSYNLSNIQKIETDYHPIVFAENLLAGKDKLTVLFYGHYDVQAPEPLNDWESDPFTATIKNDSLVARGTSDNKGDISTFLAALSAIDATGKYPVNIKILIEGGEEIGSPSLKKFIPDNKELLKADFCLNLDGGMADYGVPAITYGLRGGMRIDIKITGSDKALHSGLFGGVIQNPIHVLSKLIAGMHDEHGVITIPHFYDNVRKMSKEEKTLSATNPKDENFFLKESGAPKIWGDNNFSPYERSVLRPTFDVLMIEGGERKNAITSTASTFVSFRLVPDQNSNVIFQLFEDYLKSNLPDTMKIEIKLVSASPPSIQNFDTPQINLMIEALTKTWGVPPVIKRSGGGITVVSLLLEHLKMGTVLTGITLPDDNIHGPNEKIDIPTWKKGIESVIRFLYLLGNN